MRGLRWQSWWHARRGDVGALSIISLFFTLFFGRTILAGRFLVAADAFYYSYPLRTVAWRSLREGALPLWTPHVMAGYPLLAMSQLGLGYPLTWGYLFLSGHLAEEVYILAPFLLAPAFTYAYARELGRTRLAALLAGLSFTYGGMMLSKLGVIGMPTNSAMWLPLVLLAVERARTRRLIPCLLLSTFAFAMSVLNGHGQSFLYTGIVALGYGAFIYATAASARMRRVEGASLTARGQAWRPLAVAVGGLSLSLGIAAFQILETMRAVRRSVRSTLAYEVFSAGAFTPLETLKSFIAPVYHYVEVSTYMPPLAFALAVYGSVCALRPEGRDARLFFWVLVVVSSYVLMLGGSTPLNWLLYHVPIYNRFRYPSRHAFEWTFALSILSAYGWDAIKLRRARLHGARLNDANLHDAGLQAARRMPRPGARLLALIALASSLIAGACWWRAIGQPPIALAAPDTGYGTGLAEDIYIFWKLGFTLLVCVAVWQSWRVAATRWRAGLLIGAVMASCFVEPFIMASTWWFPDAKAASRFENASPAIRMLRAYAPEENRVYTRVNLYLVPGYPPTPPPLELPNLPALDGIHNVAGYEQLVLERFSRALGNVGADAVNLRYDVQGAPDNSIFEERSHVLDLLNTSFVVTFANLSPAPAREGQPATLAAAPPNLSPARWETMLDREGVLVLRNRRAQPRAWLVAEASAVDGEEALRRIRGESGNRSSGDDVPEFDPRRTALLEVSAEELPALPGGALAPESTIRLVRYEPTRLSLETDAPTATVAVISELFYPGWTATVDGSAQPIHLTNFLLRGVAVPAGRHRIEMQYHAPAARNGALISLCTLLLIILLSVFARRARPGRVVVG
ncbi:MAG TPA: YfhO family protein [Pyrinomonadaceae bacterium]|jgi:hypothetical protein